MKYGTVPVELESWKPTRAQQSRSREKTRAPKLWIRNRQRNQKLKQIVPCTCKSACLFIAVTQLEAADIRRTFNSWSRKEQDLFFHQSLSCSKKRGAVRKFISYNFQFGGTIHEFCREGFMSLFGISWKKIANVTNYQLSSKTLGPKALPRTGGLNKMSDFFVNQIREHILSFPAEQSHYSREKNHNRKYLESGLSINKLYELYLEKYERAYVLYRDEKVVCSKDGLPAPLAPRHEDGTEYSQPTVKCSFYRHVFVTQFNISFSRPRSDICYRCDGFATSIKNYQYLLDNNKCSRPQAGDRCCRECENCRSVDGIEAKLHQQTTKRDAHLQLAENAYIMEHHDQEIGVHFFFVVWG